MKDAGGSVATAVICARFILRLPELFVKQIIVDDRVQSIHLVVGLFPAS